METAGEPAQQSWKTGGVDRRLVVRRGGFGTPARLPGGLQRRELQPTHALPDGRSNPVRGDDRERTVAVVPIVVAGVVDRETARHLDKGLGSDHLAGDLDADEGDLVSGSGTREPSAKERRLGRPGDVVSMNDSGPRATPPAVQVDELFAGDGDRGRRPRRPYRPVPDLTSESSRVVGDVVAHRLRKTGSERLPRTRQRQEDRSFSRPHQLHALERTRPDQRTPPLRAFVRETRDDRQVPPPRNQSAGHMFRDRPSCLLLASSTEKADWLIRHRLEGLAAAERLQDRPECRLAESALLVHRDGTNEPALLILGDHDLEATGGAADTSADELPIPLDREVPTSERRRVGGPRVKLPPGRLQSIERPLGRDRGAAPGRGEPRNLRTRLGL